MGRHENALRVEGRGVRGIGREGRGRQVRNLGRLQQLDIAWGWSRGSRRLQGPNHQDRRRHHEPVERPARGQLRHLQDPDRAAQAEQGREAGPRQQRRPEGPARRHGLAGDGCGVEDDDAQQVHQRDEQPDRKEQLQQDDWRACRGDGQCCPQRRGGEEAVQRPHRRARARIQRRREGHESRPRGLHAAVAQELREGHPGPQGVGEERKPS